MRKRLWLFLGLVALSVGCATGSRLQEPYQHQKAEPPLWISWNYGRRDPGTLVAEGIIRNDLPNKFHFTDVKVHFVGLDGDGKVISREVVILPDLTRWETPFQAALKVAGPEERFDLRFEYKTEDVERNGGRGN